MGWQDEAVARGWPETETGYLTDVAARLNADVMLVHEDVIVMQVPSGARFMACRQPGTASGLAAANRARSDWLSEEMDMLDQLDRSMD